MNERAGFDEVMRSRRAKPEQAIQKAVFQHLKARAAPGVFAFAVPNGGYRKPIEAAIMKSLGTVAGVPDICAIRDGQAYFLELKADKGNVTKAQLEAIQALRKAGAKAHTARGLDEALTALEYWGILRGRAVA